MNAKKIIFILVVFILFYTNSSIASIICDKALTPVANKTIAYQKRNKQRCEGFYRAPVSSVGDIILMGLMYGSLDYNISKNPMLLLSAPLVAQKINVRAVAIPFDTYYRLDGYIKANGLLKWPLNEVVSLEKLRAEQIGLLGWLDKNETKIYVPINFGKSGQITVTVKTTMAVNQVFWRDATLTGKTCGVMSGWYEVKRDLYSYDRGDPIKIIPPQESPTGKLCLEISAKKKNEEKWFNLLIRLHVNKVTHSK